MGDHVLTKTSAADDADNCGVVLHTGTRTIVGRFRLVGGGIGHNGGCE